MTYKQTLDFLYSQLPAYHRIGKAAYRNNLDNTMALDEYFRNPHLKFRSIHIGGTNGKGSVSHMIASILQEAGYKTGLHTSPHLKDFRERIRINGKMIPRKEVVAFVEKHKKIIGSLKPSFFEMTVAMAFDYFAREKIDVAVIEVGLGGRLDSTNIITPLLSVITNIGHDHMDLLGNSLGKVAFEKAGIIKKKIPVIIGESQTETEEVFISQASEKKSEIFFADRNFTCTLSDSQNTDFKRHYIITDLLEGKQISGTIPLGGDYQEKNLKTTFQALAVLSSILNIPDDSIVKGLKNTITNTGLLGRWQILGREPLIICDNGHNREGLEYVSRQLGKRLSGNLHIIIGFVKDKDLSSVLPLLPTEARYYFTKASIERALDEKVLQSAARDFGLKGDCYVSVKEAFKAAKAIASKSDLIFVGGSTFIVAEVL